MREPRVQVKTDFGDGSLSCQAWQNSGVRPCEVSAWCWSASSGGNESHYCQCGVSFMAQTGLDSASNIVSIHL